MLCAIYKSTKKDEAYLFVPKKGDFSGVPEALLSQFGEPKLLMVMNLKPDSRLALSQPEKVLAHLDDPGYYLQLPPPKENLLDEFKQQQKRDTQ